MCHQFIPSSELSEVCEIKNKIKKNKKQRKSFDHQSFGLHDGIGVWIQGYVPFAKSDIGCHKGSVTNKSVKSLVFDLFRETLAPCDVRFECIEDKNALTVD